MVMNKGTQIPESKAQMNEKKGSKTPQENPKQVLFYDVVPDMGFKIMFRTNYDNV